MSETLIVSHDMDRVRLVRYAADTGHSTEGMERAYSPHLERFVRLLRMQFEGRAIDLVHWFVFDALWEYARSHEFILVDKEQPQTLQSWSYYVSRIFWGREFDDDPYYIDPVLLKHAREACPDETECFLLLERLARFEIDYVETRSTMKSLAKRGNVAAQQWLDGERDQGDS